MDADTPKPAGYRLPRTPQHRPFTVRQGRLWALSVLLPLLLLHVLVCTVLSAREHVGRWAPRPDAAPAGSPGFVPKIIHQMYKTTELPPKWKHVPERWAALHPEEEGWTYMLWTDATLRELVATDYPWLLPTYDSYPHPTQRWDASRYCLLHKYGGFYADLDLHPVAKVDEMLAGQTLLLPYTPNIGLTNAIMASSAGHPFMLYTIHQLPRYAHAWYHVNKHFTVLSSTGSTFIWAMHMQWARTHDAAESASLLPSEHWGKCSYCAGDPPPSAPAAHTATVIEREKRRLAVHGEGSASPPPPGEDDELSSTSSDHRATSSSAATAAATLTAAAAAAEADATALAQATRGRQPGAPALSSTVSSAAPSAATGSRSSSRTSEAAWSSPFEHGQGSSWHSLDSLLVLLAFCHLQKIIAVGLVGFIWHRSAGDRWITGSAAAVLLLMVMLQQASGIVLLETFLGRPLVWLIMS